MMKCVWVSVFVFMCAVCGIELRLFLLASFSIRCKSTVWGGEYLLWTGWGDGKSSLVKVISKVVVEEGLSIDDDVWNEAKYGEKNQWECSIIEKKRKKIAGFCSRVKKNENRKGGKKLNDGRAIMIRMALLLWCTKGVGGMNCHAAKKGGGAAFEEMRQGWYSQL